MNKLQSLISVLGFIDAVHSMLGSGGTKVRLAPQIGGTEFPKLNLIWISRFQSTRTPTTGRRWYKFLRLWWWRQAFRSPILLFHLLMKDWTIHIQDFGEMTSLEIISGPLSAQIVCFKAKFTDGKSQLLDCLRTLVENATWDDALLKSISLKVLNWRMLEFAYLPCRVLTLSADPMEETSSVCAIAFACLRNFNVDIGYFSSRICCGGCGLHCGM